MSQNHSEGQRLRWRKLRAKAKKMGATIRKGGSLSPLTHGAIPAVLEELRRGPGRPRSSAVLGASKQIDPLAKERKIVAKKTDAELAQSLRGHVGYVNLIMQEARKRGLEASATMHPGLGGIQARISKLVDL